jgi:hypothetical protein
LDCRPKAGQFGQPSLGKMDRGSAGVTALNIKEKMLKAIQELPDDATIKDAMERLYLLYKVEREIAQADAGQKVSQDEARRRMAKWLQ